MGQNPTVSQQQSQQSKRGRTHVLEGEPKSPVGWGRRSSSSGAQRMGGGDANQGGGGATMGLVAWHTLSLTCLLWHFLII